MSLIRNIKGVNFFETPHACISNYNDKPRRHKVLSFIKSCWTLIAYYPSKVRESLGKAGKVVSPYITPEGPLTKERLVVCLHGRNNHPVQFKKMISIFKNKDLSNTEIYAPHILQKGNAKLDEMVEPIFEEIRKWAEQEGDKELVLVGISNGGRVARALEAKLMNSECKDHIKKLKFVSIVGANKGSSLVNIANKCHLAWLIGKNTADEMPVDSDRHTILEQDIQTGEKSCPFDKEYTFIASPHDWLVPNYSSTLLEKNNYQARYAIVPNHGHCSIVDKVSEAVAEIIFEPSRVL